MSQQETPKLLQPELIPGPYPVQFKGHMWAAWLLKLIGWRVDFQGLPSMQGVAIVYPHTSNWDFLTAMLSKWTMGMPIYFLTKDSLFKIPLVGPWIRWIGGVPTVRSSSQGVVGSMVEVFAEHERANTFFWLGLSPEGTASTLKDGAVVFISWPSELSCPWPSSDLTTKRKNSSSKALSS